MSAPLATATALAPLALGRAVLHHGDCRDVLPTLAEASADACVTDPPYRLGAQGFMGRAWDASDVAFDPTTWAAVLRVLRPGAPLLAFGGTRTWHRMVCAIEDAGFEVFDSITWIYGSGWPKAKGLLKPGHEPICVARKPGRGSGLQTEACRVDYGGKSLDEVRAEAGSPGVRTATRQVHKGGWGLGDGKVEFNPAGRWPPNVVFSHRPECAEGGACDPECPVAALDVQAGTRKSGAMAAGTKVQRKAAVYQGDAGRPLAQTIVASEGGASRFFPVFRYEGKARGAERKGNTHPTVKPLALMRWLVRLATPPGGLVLDPFTGSGSTLVAAETEGLRSIGVELLAEHVEIARARLAQGQGGLPL